MGNSMNPLSAIASTNNSISALSFLSLILIAASQIDALLTYTSEAFIILDRVALEKR
jgi:hypothetical protein